MTWEHQIEESQAKGLKRTSLIKKFAGTSWGANLSMLKKAYTGYVRPAIEYGIPARELRQSLGWKRCKIRTFE